MLKLTVLFLSPTSVDEILLVENYDSKRTTELTHTLIQTQYEWLFINMTVTNKTIDLFDFRQSVIIYTVSIFSTFSIVALAWSGFLAHRQFGQKKEKKNNLALDMHGHVSTLPNLKKAILRGETLQSMN